MSDVKGLYIQHFILLTVLAFIGYLGVTEGLLCYQCSDSANNGKCRTDIEGMEDEFTQQIYPANISTQLPLNESHYTYVQLCDQEYCIVEDITQNGRTVSFIRGCSSGKYDSLPKAFYTTGDNIQANNKTSCGTSKDGGMLMCVTICQKDLCNGPQVDPPVNTGCKQVNELAFLGKTVLLAAFTYLLSSKYNI